MSLKFCVLNGHVCPENDGFTCCTARGVSVVDYCIVPHECLGSCSNFCVASMTDLLTQYDIKYLLGLHCKAPYAMLSFDLCVNVASVGNTEGVQQYVSQNNDTSSLKFNLASLDLTS